MYALAINGSPRKNGNTRVLLEETLKPLAAAGWETEFVQLGGKDIRGCLACGKCAEKQNLRCINSKDMFNEVFERMVRADALILGSPTYFADVSAELKALLDRSGMVALVNGRVFKGKIGAAVVAVRRGGATHVFDSINHMYLMSEMLVPGSTYWNMGCGLNEGEVASDNEGMANMRNLGRTIAWLGKAIHPHLAEFPAGE